MNDELVKKGALLLVKFVAAAAVPPLIATSSWFIAPLAAALPFLLTKEGDGDSPLEKALGGLANALTEVLGGKAGQALDDFLGLFVNRRERPQNVEAGALVNYPLKRHLLRLW